MNPLCARNRRMNVVSEYRAWNEREMKMEWRWQFDLDATSQFSIPRSFHVDAFCYWVPVRVPGTVSCPSSFHVDSGRSVHSEYDTHFKAKTFNVVFFYASSFVWFKHNHYLKRNAFQTAARFKPSARKEHSGLLNSLDMADIHHRRKHTRARATNVGGAQRGNNTCCTPSQCWVQSRGTGPASASLWKRSWLPVTKKIRIDITLSTHHRLTWTTSFYVDEIYFSYEVDTPHRAYEAVWRTPVGRAAVHACINIQQQCRGIQFLTVIILVPRSLIRRDASPKYTKFRRHMLWRVRSMQWAHSELLRESMPPHTPPGQGRI
jgi:hypothetical protein